MLKRADFAGRKPETNIFFFKTLDLVALVITDLYLLKLNKMLLQKIHIFKVRPINNPSHRVLSDYYKVLSASHIQSAISTYKLKCTRSVRCIVALTPARQYTCMHS